jgi:hypothetical protein
VPERYNELNVQSTFGSVNVRSSPGGPTLPESSYPMSVTDREIQRTIVADQLAKRGVGRLIG